MASKYFCTAGHGLNDTSGKNMVVYAAQHA